MGRSTDIGTKAETEVVRTLLRAGISAARHTKEGSKDPGDVWAKFPDWGVLYVIEVKAGEQTKSATMSRTPSWGQIEKWWQEAITEAANVRAKPEVAVQYKGVYPILVVRRWGSGRGEDWWAYTRLGDMAVCARFGDLIRNWKSRAYK